MRRKSMTLQVTSIPPVTPESEPEFYRLLIEALLRCLGDMDIITQSQLQWALGEGR